MFRVRLRKASMVLLYDYTHTHTLTKSSKCLNTQSTKSHQNYIQYTNKPSAPFVDVQMTIVIFWLVLMTLNRHSMVLGFSLELRLELAHTATKC